MRWAQLTLVENDPGRFDPQFWLDYFHRVHADAACLSAGGIVAYYPTNVPLHHRSAWLGDSDPFGTLVAGLPRAQHARHRAHRSARGARRGATRRIRTGSPCGRAASRTGTGPIRSCGSRARSAPTTSSSWIRCIARSSRRTRSTASSRTAGRGSGRLLLRALPRELPCRDRPRSAAHDRSRAIRFAGAFLAWRVARLTELWKQWDRTVRSANPDARFIPNGPPDLKTAGELAAIQFADNQARHGLMPPWANGRRAKEYRSVMGEPADRRHLQRGVRRSLSLEGLRAERAGDPAVGRRGHGQRHAPVVHAILGRALRPPLAADGRAHLRLALRATRPISGTRAPIARVALFYSEQTATFHPGVAHGDRAADHVLGMYHALVESRVPFEMVHEAFLTPDRIDRFKLLVLADAAALSDAQCAAIRALRRARRQRARDVRDVALRRTRPPARQLRPGRRLRRLVRRTRVDGPMQNSYLSLDADPADRAGAIRFSTASTDTPRIINGVFRLQCHADGRVPVAHHADSDLSGSADGGCLSARAAHRHARGVPARSRAEAA